MDTGLLVLRIVLGLYLFGHGTQKLFGWFGGPGLAGATKGMGSAGFRWPAAAALLGAGGETAGGVLVALGLLSPLGPLAVAAAMVVAVSVHWGGGVWGAKGGYEMALTNLAAALALAFAGPGRFSVDVALGIALPEPLVGTVIALGALVTVAAFVATRRPAAAGQGQQARARAS